MKLQYVLLYTLIFLMPFTFALPPLRQSLNDSYNSIKESFSDAWDSLARKIEKRYYDAGDWVTQKLRGTIVKFSVDTWNNVSEKYRATEEWVSTRWKKLYTWLFEINPLIS
ncbi:PREDICTED: uncharacterized protein LOC106102229 [Papilio polytes]|uniref:uncharacterized protein LOC106102229 n=1 Tax=Papilio polytes TaxID=76194 RepID=UPI0006765C75|nr:PREDICTED: uncharacterized protein LOC106102229 [Papilio polytes]